MDTNKKNHAAIMGTWKPIVEKLTEGYADPKTVASRMDWLCEIAHNQHTEAIRVMNEAADTVGGVSMPISNLHNTLGIGNAVPAGSAAMTGADQTGRANVGSGDKWPTMLPLAVQVAANTIAFDLVNVHPMDGPSGVIPFLDYVYSDSKNPYGATPSYSAATANPQIGVGGVEKAWHTYSMPSAFRVKADLSGATDASLKTRKAFAKAMREDASLILIGDKSANNAFAEVEFIGLSRLTAEPMFHVRNSRGTLGEIFESGEVEMKDDYAGIKLSYPRLVSMLEDQIQGYTGSGKYDNDRWTGTFQDPFHVYEPMDRATGEMQYPRHLSLQVMTKFITVGKIQTAVAVTREQVTDLQKQWGIDVMKLAENGGLNELTQTINKHILSRLFAHGWRNHVEAYEAEGVNLNLSLVKDTNNSFISTQIKLPYLKDGVEVAAEMPVPGAQFYGDFENMDTIFSRVSKLIKTAGNVIMQRSRRGPATFVVANYKVASMLQDAAQYSFAPQANTFNQNNGQLYPLGTTGGMTIYVDPLMKYDDTRVLVGRKGGKDEPGVFFCPYLMAESVNFIDKDTFAPKVVIQSRYSLVDCGWYPYLSYLTLFLNLPENLY